MRIDLLKLSSCRDADLIDLNPGSTTGSCGGLPKASRLEEQGIRQWSTTWNKTAKRPCHHYSTVPGHDYFMSTGRLQGRLFQQSTALTF